MRKSTKVLVFFLCFWLVCYWHTLNPYSDAQSPVSTVTSSGISGLTTNRQVRATSATTVGNSGCSTDDGTSVIACPGSDGVTSYLITKADGSTHVVNIDTTNSRVCIGCTSVNPIYPFVVGNTNTTLTAQAGAGPTTTGVWRSANDTAIGIQLGHTTDAGSFNYWNSAGTLGADFEYDFNGKTLGFVTRVSGAKTLFYSDNTTQVFQTNGGRFEEGSAQQTILNGSGLLTKYNNVSTAGWGTPAIYAAGRATAQTASNASISTYTVGAADGSFEVSANVNVTTATAHNFTVTCTYTDETNTSRTLTFGFTQLTGSTFLTAITNVTGAGPYESPLFHIRAKASTAITIATTGTFTTVTYNVEGIIKQIS